MTTLGSKQAAAEALAPDLRGEPDVAALALYLASARGKRLSGCVFEARIA